MVRGADQYNNLVCRGYAALNHNDNEKALELFLAASKQPVLEAPNLRLFGRIALVYTKLSRFHESDTYLEYENLSLLWMIAIVRCQTQSNTTEEELAQDGTKLSSAEAKHMADVLCGPVFDEFSYFQDHNSESFVPAAEAILRHETIRKEIDLLKGKSAK